MNSSRNIVAGLVLMLSSGIVFAQPFDQKGPTGDNRAATGNTGTQVPPNENAKDAARRRQPQRPAHNEQSAQRTGQANSAAPTNASGVPAENSTQPEGAK